MAEAMRAVPPGGEELREALIDTLRLYGIRGERLGSLRPQSVADAVLALPAVRDALAAQEKVKRVEALADWYAAQVEWQARDTADRIRRALDGE
jgi:hypothetical protein